MAKIDTGASYCLFERQYGEALGLRVEDGVRQTYSTVNSQFEAYGHEVSIQVLGTEAAATVYFYSTPTSCEMYSGGAAGSTAFALARSITGEQMCRPGARESCMFVKTCRHAPLSVFHAPEQWDILIRAHANPT